MIPGFGNPPTNIGSQYNFSAVSSIRNPDYDYKYDRPVGDGVIELIQQVKSTDMTVTNQRWQRAARGISFAAGDSSDFSVSIMGGPLQAAAPMGQTFNIIQSKLNIVSGMQRNHRRSLQAQSNHPSGNSTADKYSRLLVYSDNKGDLSKKFSLGFDKGMLTGLALSEIQLDRTNDVINGDIKMKLWEYNSFIIDYSCRDIWDFSDCKYLWCQAYVDKRAAIAQYPDHAKAIQAFGPGAYGNPTFMFLPEAITPRQKDTVIISRFWSKVNVEQTVWIDLITGMTHFKRPEFLGKFEMYKLKKNVWRLTILVNDQIVDEHIAPNGLEDLPFISHTWDYWPELQQPGSRVRGLPDVLASSQWMINRQIILNHTTCETSINSGLVYEEGSLVDEEVDRRSGPGINVSYVKGTPQPQQIQPVALPPSNFELVNQLLAMADKSSGISDAMTGIDSQSKSGLMEMIRQDASVVGIQKYFDDSDRSLIRSGKLQIKIQQKNWTHHKMAMILNIRPEETNDLFDANLLDYTIVVSEGIFTDVQKRIEFMNAAEVCALAGVRAPPKYLIEKAPIQGTNELIAAIEIQEKESKEAQMQQQAIELASKEAEIGLIKAKSTEQLNLAISHKARSGSYLGLEHERNAEVAKNFSITNKNNSEALLKIEPLIEKYGESKFFDLLSKLAETDDLTNLETKDVEEAIKFKVPDSGSL